MQIAIVDDQVEFLELIYDKVKSLNYEFYSFRSVHEMEKVNIHFDLILLDIDMPDCNGLDYARENKDKNIVFITSLSECMKEAFGSNIYGFIEKSDTDERYREVIESTVQEIYGEKYITLKIKEGYQDFKIKDIVYIQRYAPRSLSFVYQNHSYNLKGYTLKKLETQLDDFFFIFDRGTLVNKGRIETMINDQLYLKGVSQTFTVSVRRKQDIKELLRQRVRR